MPVKHAARVSCRSTYLQEPVAGYLQEPDAGKLTGILVSSLRFNLPARTGCRSTYLQEPDAGKPTGIPILNSPWKKPAAEWVAGRIGILELLLFKLQVNVPVELRLYLQVPIGKAAPVIA
ncbi:hypothetical protein B0H16DRAFT_1445707 [Mycena metata]|uniref:Uncharacterized protein n=1 Tax=Mycena metata TaxID=1033252 RepID=A0AAD7KIN0_9AGAR|nr:hypothetical protein B0H16DRAFT_1445707 [Mycena metata]